MLKGVGSGWAEAHGLVASGDGESLAGMGKVKAHSFDEQLEALEVQRSDAHLMQATQHQAKQASQQPQSEAWQWLHGIPPLAMYLRPPSMPENIAPCEGSLAMVEFDGNDETVCLGTDGTGGRHISEPRLRSGAWSRGSISSGLEGPVQSFLKAEPMAAVALRKITLLHFVANKFALKLGDDAAEQYQPSNWADEKFQEVAAMGTDIQRRRGLLPQHWCCSGRGELAQQS